MKTSEALGIAVLHVLSNVSAEAHVLADIEGMGFVVQTADDKVYAYSHTTQEPTKDGMVDDLPEPTLLPNGRGITMEEYYRLL